MKSVILALLFFLLVLLIAGLYKPWLILWYIDVKTRLKVISYLLPPIIVLLIYVLLVYYF